MFRVQFHLKIYTKTLKPNHGKTYLIWTKQLPSCKQTQLDWHWISCNENIFETNGLSTQPIRQRQTVLCCKIQYIWNCYSNHQLIISGWNTDTKFIKYLPSCNTRFVIFRDSKKRRFFKRETPLDRAKQK